MVAPIILGYKVEMVRWCRFQNRLEGFPAGICNRPRRQPTITIRVVWTGGSKIRFGQVSIEIRKAIDDCWIAFEPHPLFEPI